jgi:DNA repair exonuclease SbcCD ATPase subunit
MSKYTPEQIAAVFDESRRILSDEPPPEPLPAPPREAMVPEAEDPVAKWRREADEFDRKREAERAAMGRREHEEREALVRARALDGAEERITALEERMDAVEQQISELSRAVGDFSSSVSDAMLRQEKQLDKLSTLLTSLRAADDQRRVVDLPKLVRRTN